MTFIFAVCLLVNLACVVFCAVTLSLPGLPKRYVFFAGMIGGLSTCISIWCFVRLVA